MKFLSTFINILFLLTVYAMRIFFGVNIGTESIRAISYLRCIVWILLIFTKRYGLIVHYIVYLLMTFALGYFLLPETTFCMMVEDSAADSVRVTDYAVNTDSATQFFFDKIEDCVVSLQTEMLKLIQEAHQGQISKYQAISQMEASLDKNGALLKKISDTAGNALSASQSNLVQNRITLARNDLCMHTTNYCNEAQSINEAPQESSKKFYIFGGIFLVSSGCYLIKIGLALIKDGMDGF